MAKYGNYLENIIDLVVIDIFHKGCCYQTMLGLDGNAPGVVWQAKIILSSNWKLKRL